MRGRADPADLAGADLVVLPGSKHVAADLAWLRAAGLDRAVAAPAARGTRCSASAAGCRCSASELATRAGSTATGAGSACCRCAPPSRGEADAARRGALRAGLAGPWAGLAGIEVHGYEIPTATASRPRPWPRRCPAASAGRKGPLLAVSVHGVLEDREVLAALLGSAPARSLDEAIDDLTDAVMASLDVPRIESLAATTRAL